MEPLLKRKEENQVSVGRRVVFMHLFTLLLAEVHYGSPGRRSSPKPSPSFDVDSLAVDMVSSD